MIACRESYSILFRLKIGGLKYVFALFRQMNKRYFDWSLFFEDNFCPVVCFLVGHKKYEAEQGEFACYRCHKFIK